VVARVHRDHIGVGRDGADRPQPRQLRRERGQVEVPGAMIERIAEGSSSSTRSNADPRGA
jgi:hypothetical protein